MKASSKFFILATTLLVLNVSSVSAQAIRKCTDEVLTCRLDQLLISGGRIFVAEQTEKFSGLNTDEPSIEPEECTIDLWMEKNETAFSVKIGDSDYMTNVYSQNLNNLGKLLPGSVAFPLVKGKNFYYESNRLLLTCSLK